MYHTVVTEIVVVVWYVLCGQYKFWAISEHADVFIYSRNDSFRLVFTIYPYLTTLFDHSDTIHNKRNTIFTCIQTIQHNGGYNQGKHIKNTFLNNHFTKCS